MTKDEVEKRKRDHLAYFRDGKFPPGKRSTWLECVRLLHNALPELAPGALDLSANPENCTRLPK